MASSKSGGSRRRETRNEGAARGLPAHNPRDTYRAIGGRTSSAGARAGEILGVRTWAETWRYGGKPGG